MNLIFEFTSKIDNHLDKMTSWLYIFRLWGQRCKSYNPECPVCEKWADHDEIFNKLKK